MRSVAGSSVLFYCAGCLSSGVLGKRKGSGLFSQCQKFCMFSVI